MSNARNIASGAKFVDAAGDTMTGNLGIGASPSVPLDVVKAGGGNFVARFQNTTDATPYGIHVKDAASGANGYPLLQVTNSAGSVAHLKVNSGTGHVTMPNQPMFDAYLTANSNHTSGVYNLSTGDSWATRANIGNHFNSGTFTAPVAGRYLFTANLTANGSVGSMSYFGLEFQINGSRRYIHWWGKGGSGGSYFAANNAAIMNLAANDVVRLASEKAQATTIVGGSGYTSFTGILLG